MKGRYHPRGPGDVPLRVAVLLEPVADLLADLEAEARARKGW